MTRKGLPAGSVVRLTEVNDRAAALADLTAIFFESSSRTSFDSEADRQAFLHRWTAPYLSEFPDDVWVWREAGGMVTAYLTGCRDSAAAAVFFTALPLYQAFEPWFFELPAHLHVNCRADRRGFGIGARLIDAFLTDCRQAGVAGVHVVTAPGARNVRFYRRLGFTKEVLSAHAGRPLLLLGQHLTKETSA